MAAVLNRKRLLEIATIAVTMLNTVPFVSITR
jgi:hypothetical protein